ncbi:MAG: zf-HC2 domain-containing protein [Deltaproteobacteria bacterium]|nr:zf-HC2 domain-containing protein [Deltaproteobacteria bacterium]
MSQAWVDLFARDGHVTLLSLDRYEAGELSAGERRGLEGHVEGCGRCRARMQALSAPAVVLPPPLVDAHRSSGSATVAYIAAVAAVAVAAGLVLGVGSAMWPSPHTAQQSVSEPGHMASAYTSVAQDYDDTDGVGLELELEHREHALVLTPRAEGHVAVFVLDDAQAGGDTDGDAEQRVVGTLLRSRLVSEAVRVPVPRRTGPNVVAVMCSAPIIQAIAEAFAPEPGCVVREGAP